MSKVCRLSTISFLKILYLRAKCGWLAEVKADDTKAVVAVVNADTHRLSLLEECDKLQAKVEKTTATEEEEERLKEVRMSISERTMMRHDVAHRRII